MKNIAVIILAAGKSTRMKSEIPKVLHPICGRPMICYVLDLVKGLKAGRAIAVLGHKHTEIQPLLTPGIKVVLQERLLGTADAVKQAMSKLSGFSGTILVLYADNPLLKKETIAKLLKHHIENKSDATLLTAAIEKPIGYGRILRDKYEGIRGIVEEKDADDFQKEIKEINTGIICFNSKKLFDSLRYVQANNRKKEYYLTDTIEIIYTNGGLISNVRLDDINEAAGINSRIDLAKANKIMQGRINERLMKQGITIIDPDSTFINFSAKINRDVTIYPFTVIEKDVKIGNRCVIGPFVHLRERTTVENDVTIGNFVETIRSKIGVKTLIKHFSYIGDTQVGKFVNIGAGVVTANFDGERKNKTQIKDKAFIGSDTVLIAPVKVGKGAKTGAGSVVTKNTAIPDNTVVVGVPAKHLITK